MIAAANSLPGAQVGQWGVFAVDGNAVAEFAAFLSLGYKAEGKVAKKPVELGSFYSANKWLDPFETEVCLGANGDEATLKGFVEALDAAQAGTDLLSVVTPYKTYLNVNLTKLDYDLKAENGAGLLVANLKLEEIREVEAEYTDVDTSKLSGKQTKNPADAGTQDRGKQQPKEPPKSTLTKTKEWLNS